MSATCQTSIPPRSQSIPTVRKRPGPKPKPVVESPEATDDSWEEPTTFREALALHMQRHGDTCWQLWKAVVRRRERFDKRTIPDWVSGGCVPRSALSMVVRARIEHRYRLPTGYFKALLPHSARATSRPRLADVEPAEQRRLAWHLSAFFARVLDDLFIQRMDGNDEIFSRVMSDKDFRTAAQEHLAREVYERVRSSPTSEPEQVAPSSSSSV